METNDRIILLLIKLFTHKRITIEDVNIQSTHQKIFEFIIQRKYHKKLDFDHSRGSQFEQELEQLSFLRNSKRLEESLKFVFSRAFKYLRAKLERENCPQSFFEHYFGHISGRGIKALKKQLNSRKSQKLGTLNNSYFELLFKSETFGRDFEDFLENKLELIWMSELKRKFQKLLQKIHFKKVEQLRSYFLLNKRCKLPWTMCEVKDAICRGKELLKLHRPSAR